MPPRKRVEDGQVEFHANFSPLTVPLAYVGATTVCFVSGGNVCLWDTESGSRDFLYVSTFSITKICGNPTAGLLAFCEGGTSPQVFVYNLNPQQLLHTFSDVSELELADLAFSSCGSRLYTLSRATTRRLCIFCVETGEKLNGCELSLPTRFDKLSVFPAHKDHVALIRTTGVRIVTLHKSFQTYIPKLHPASIPAENEQSILSFTWTAPCQFVFSTRQGLLCILDGHTGVLMHVCQTDQPITCIAATPRNILTVHVGNTLKMWAYNGHELVTPGQPISLSDVPMIESIGDIYEPHLPVDLSSLAENTAGGHTLVGQVGQMQVSPTCTHTLLTSSEGELWTFSIAALESHLSDDDTSAKDPPQKKFECRRCNFRE